MSGKLAFRGVMQGRHEGNPPFLPFLYGLAARTANVSLKDMVSDASYYANALEGVYRLLNYDVIATGYDSTIEGERWGGEVEWSGEYSTPVLVRGGDLSLIRPDEFLEAGRVRILLEVTKRLVISVGRDAAIVCVVSGPCSLLRGLRSASDGPGVMDAATTLKLLGGFLNKLIRSLCEFKVDGVIFREDPLGPDLVEQLSLNKDACRSLYATLFNIVRAFNGFPMVSTSHLTVDGAKTVHGLLRPDGIILLGTHFDGSELLVLSDLADASRTSFGLPLPIGTGPQEVLWDRLGAIEAFVAANRSRRFFLASDGEIPYDVHMEVLHRLMARLKAGNGQH